MLEWWAALTAAEKVFVAIATPFSILTLIQLVMELAGGGGETDIGGFDFDAADSFGDHFHFFSVRSMIYFLTMFGWTGLACSKVGIPIFITIPIALISGAGTSLFIGWLFYMFNKMTESGNVKMQNAVGKIGSVYLTIPEKRSGMGVIQVNVQGATQELNAMTDGEKIPTGKQIQIVELMSNNTALVTGADTFSAV